MKKLLYLKEILSSMNISEDQLSAIDLLIKLSAISAPDSKTRGERTRSTLYGDKKQDSDEKPKDEKEEEDGPHEPIDSGKTVDLRESEVDITQESESPIESPTQINCAGKYINIENIYNFSKNEFIDDCDLKICLIKYIISETGENKNLLSYIKLIKYCIDNYRESLSNSEFKKLNDSIVGDNNYNTIRGIIIGEEETDDWMDGTFGDSKRLFIFEEMQDEYISDFKYRFFSFCKNNLDEVINFF